MNVRASSQPADSLRRARVRVSSEPLAPLVVLVCGVMAALLVALLGIHALRQTSHAATASGSGALASSLARTLGQQPPGQWSSTVKVAVTKVPALEIFVLDPSGHVHTKAVSEVLAPVTLRELRERGDGEITTERGLAHFSARAINAEHSALVLMYPRSSQTGDRSLATTAYLNSLAAATLVFLIAACLASYLMAREGSKNLLFVASRVRAMAQSVGDPLLEPLRLRSLDEVGELTASFNELLARYRSAEARYLANVERTRASDGDRAAFLAAVSHEFYTPLNAILGFTEVLLEQIEGPLSEDAREEAQQILESGQHLKQLIDDIVEFSALEGGQLRLKRTRMDLVPLTAEVVREASVVAAQKGLTLQMRATPPVWADIDPLRLRQVLANLISNAIKFTQKGGVLVEVGRRGRRPLVCVRDTGPGIADADRSGVFKEFVQAEAGRRAAASGSGLGLAIARRLVALHGGSIELDSELGRGSTFRVVLPEPGAVDRFAEWEPTPAADPFNLLSNSKKNHNGSGAG